MDKITLVAEKRKILGRKVRKLRREGVLPANVFGKQVVSLALQVPLRDFLKVYEEAGETGIVELKVDSEVKPVLVTNVQLNPVTNMPVHADFRQVNLEEKITTQVPIEISGEAPATRSGVGILVQQLSEIEVEALPGDLPEKLVADVSRLENVDDAILVKDLIADRRKVALMSTDEQIVAKIEPLAKEEVAPPPAEVAVPAEGEAPAEGEEAPAPEEKPAAEKEKTTEE